MSTPTLGTDLELRRLQHRAQRIEHVLAALRHRVVYRSETDGGVPEPLRQAIAGFDAELHDLRARLACLGQQRAAA